MSVPSNVGVIGGGRMGAGIAHAFLMAGSDVVVVESRQEWADSAHQRVAGSVRTSIERGANSEEAEVLGRLRATTDSTVLSERQLVVEAIPEDLDLKVEALREVESHVSEDTWVVTNTSSLSVTEISDRLARPARFGGLHFFNPVPASALVEIVVGRHTDPAYSATASEWVSGLGKTGIVVRDTPGFASSRLGLAIALEAMRMVEEDVASAADIDTAMELGYRHPVGPLRTSDIVGLDVRLAIAEHLFATLGQRFEPPAILRRLVAEGALGRKSGRGFFDYRETPDA
jgi:3-hydroxybutyryl-CoA dehydrogenase